MILPKGLNEILTEIQQSGGSTFTELKSKVRISSSTLQKRLRESTKANLIESKSITDENGKPRTKYIITPNGKKFISDYKMLEDNIKKFKGEYNIFKGYR